MGRFYEAPTANFVDDFIYQPPWDLAMMAAAKKEQDVQTSLDTMELMRNLPINYWKGVDDKRAADVKDYWNNKINSIAGDIGKDLLNPENKAKLIMLKNELSKDVTSGNIAKLQQNADAYNKFEQARLALKNPADRDMYLKQIQMYKDANPDGAYNSIFKPDEMYDTRNLWEEYVGSDSFKALRPNEKASDIQNVNGKWLVKVGDDWKGLEESKIGKNFMSWIGNQTDLKMYAHNRAKYNNERWFNDDGTFGTEEGTMLGNMMINGIPSLAYSSESNSKEMTANPYVLKQMDYDHDIYMEKLRNQHQIDQENRAAKAARTAQAIEQMQGNLQLPETKVKTASLLKISLDLQDKLKKTHLGEAAKKFGVSPEVFVTKLVKNGAYYKNKYPGLYKEAVSFYNELNSNRIASRQSMVDLANGNRKEVDYLENQINKKLKTNYFSLPLADGTVTGKRYNLTQMNTPGFKIDGVSVKPGSAKFSDDVTYVPGTTIGRSVIVKPLNFLDTRGVEHTTLVYAQAQDFL